MRAGSLRRRGGRGKRVVQGARAGLLPAQLTRRYDDDDTMDAALKKFLAQHATSPREAVERDVAELRTLTPEETWAIIDAVCLSAADVLSMRPDRAAELDRRDPPHPSYEAVMRRLRAGYRYSRA